MRPDELISRARSGLIQNAPFFATLALGLEAISRDDIDTMATDGESLFYSPAFVEETPSAELRGVVAHEVLHVAMLHHTRRGNRDPKLWNIACDYVVNLIIKAEGFELPAGCLIDSRFEGQSAEQVYSTLQSEGQGQGAQSGAQPGQGAPQPGQGQGSAPQPGQGAQSGAQPGGDPGGCGQILDAAPSHDAAALQAAEINAKTRVIQATQIAKRAGDCPGFAAAMVDAIRKPVVDWRAVLRRFVDESARRDYSWSRPNRRHIAAGLYLPGSIPDGMRCLGVVIDRSVSCPPESAARFIGEVQGAIDEACPERVVVVHCNTEVTRRDEYQPGDTISPEVTIGGGTDMRPGFAALPDDCAAILCFTDLEFRKDRIPDRPAAPVLWCRWGGDGIAIPYGEEITL